VKQQKQSQLEIITVLREDIKNSLSVIESLVKEHFPDHYADAYQHWIPQVLTALYNDIKWLPRGTLTLQDMIDRIKDHNESAGGVSKYIK
jgi:hypothetical protein